MENNNFFGTPVNVDGQLISCVDVLCDLPQDAGRLFALHANISAELRTAYIAVCQKIPLSWERGAKRFYATAKNIKAVISELAKIGIESAISPSSGYFSI